MTAKKKTGETVKIKEANIQRVTAKIRGIAPYVQNRMTAKAIANMREDMEDPAGKKRRARERKEEARDFEQECEQSTRVSTEGWYGIPSNGLGQALVDAVRLVEGLTMTNTKMALTVIPDGFDARDGMPLTKITKGKPIMSVMLVDQNGRANLRSRPMWLPGWVATVTIEFDGDPLTKKDVANLLARVGAQIGIGSGRPFSKQSCGLGWGRFELVK